MSAQEKVTFLTKELYFTLATLLVLFVYIQQEKRLEKMSHLHFQTQLLLPSAVKKVPVTFSKSCNYNSKWYSIQFRRDGQGTMKPLKTSRTNGTLDIPIHYGSVTKNRFYLSVEGNLKKLIPFDLNKKNLLESFFIDDQYFELACFEK